mmetsp:Transcript_5428/g.16131  ORF Transcript_5428/g.16131 Transcript_5428/m.16131 type:complete len:312 (-) Transcript_5428:122-1057(-)
MAIKFPHAAIAACIPQPQDAALQADQSSPRRPVHLHRHDGCLVWLDKSLRMILVRDVPEAQCAINRDAGNQLCLPLDGRARHLPRVPFECPQRGRAGVQAPESESGVPRCRDEFPSCPRGNDGADRQPMALKVAQTAASTEVHQLKCAAGAAGQEPAATGLEAEGCDRALGLAESLRRTSLRREHVPEAYRSVEGGAEQQHSRHAHEGDGSAGLHAALRNAPVTLEDIAAVDELQPGPAVERPCRPLLWPQGRLAGQLALQVLNERRRVEGQCRDKLAAEAHHTEPARGGALPPEPGAEAAPVGRRHSGRG